MTERTNLTRAVVLPLLGMALGVAMMASAQTDHGLDFDGGDWIVVPADPSLKPTAALTVEAWVRPRDTQDAWGGAGFILSDGRDCCNPNSAGGIGLHLLAGQAPRGYLWDTMGQKDVRGAPMMPLNWHHVAFTFDGAALRMYQDGILTGENVLATPTVVLPNSLDLLVGILNFQVPTFYRFNGTMDDVRIWNVARTADEICAGSRGELTGLEPGLLAYFAMNEGAGQVVGDLTGNGHHGQLGASPAPEPSDPTWVTPGFPRAPRGACSAAPPASPISS